MPKDTTDRVSLAEIRERLNSNEALEVAAAAWPGTGRRPRSGLIVALEALGDWFSSNQTDHPQEPQGEACPECGRRDCPWQMPDIDALQKAADDLDSGLCEAELYEWSELLLALREGGWELRRIDVEAKQ